MAGTKSLFVPGPTNVPDSVRKAIDVPMEDHRAPDLPDFILPLFSDLKKVFKTAIRYFWKKNVSKSFIIL